MENKKKKPNFEEQVTYKTKNQSTTHLLIGLIVGATIFIGFWYYSLIGTTNSSMVEPEQKTSQSQANISLHQRFHLLNPVNYSKDPMQPTVVKQNIRHNTSYALVERRFHT